MHIKFYARVGRISVASGRPRRAPPIKLSNPSAGLFLAFSVQPLSPTTTARNNEARFLSLSPKWAKSHNLARSLSLTLALVVVSHGRPPPSFSALRPSLRLCELRFPRWWTHSRLLREAPGSFQGEPICPFSYLLRWLGDVFSVLLFLFSWTYGSPLKMARTRNARLTILGSME